MLTAILLSEIVSIACKWVIYRNTRGVVCVDFWAIENVWPDVLRSKSPLEHFVFYRMLQFSWNIYVTIIRKKKIMEQV